MMYTHDDNLFRGLNRMTNHFYEKYETVLNNPRLNPTFDEILAMDTSAFSDWVKAFRKAVVYEWDINGQPPRVGYDREGIIDNFRKLKEHPVATLPIVDLMTGTKDVIRNTTTFGNAINQFFPTMMKTRITYSKDVADSKSIYDYFASDDLLDTFTTYAHRHFHRDSFYHYSAPISVGDDIMKPDGTKLFVVSADAEAFIASFERRRNKPEFKDIEYFFCPVKEDKTYTGFNVALKQKQNLVVTTDDITLWSYTYEIPKKCRTNVTPTSTHYAIRLYKKGQRLFPVGLKAFRVSFCQYAVNFPPLTARYLYEKYTSHLGTRVSSTGDTLPIIVYDPSAGWGGRLLGAMSVHTNANLLYVGTDPNTDHNIPGGKTKYHDIAGFFNRHVRESGSLFPSHGHAYHIFQSGSEEISKLDDFRRYRESVDMVFTSPPYFAKEVYSEDPEQSCHKFSEYETWRAGFLEPTLTTAVEWLRPGGYLLWNIADAVFAGKMLPLEQDSKDILEKLGMEFVGVEKMTLAQMPGGNRTEETGETEDFVENTLGGAVTTTVAKVKGKMKNFCMIRPVANKSQSQKSMMLKYEPIFVYRKKVAETTEK